jgi:hypothetical protein
MMLRRDVVVRLHGRPASQDKLLKVTGRQLRLLTELLEELLKKHDAPAETSPYLVSNQQPLLSA